MGGNKPLVCQNYIKILSFWHVTPPMYNVIKNFKFVFPDSVAYKETCCKPVGLLYKNKPFSTKIKLVYVNLVICVKLM